MTITSAPGVRASRPGRRMAGTAGVWLLVLPGLVWAVLRLFGWERGYLVQAWPSRRTRRPGHWCRPYSRSPCGGGRPGRPASLAVAIMAVCVVPRALPDRRPGAGDRLRAQRDDDQHVRRGGRPGRDRRTGPGEHRGASWRCRSSAGRRAGLSRGRTRRAASLRGAGRRGRHHRFRSLFALSDRHPGRSATAAATCRRTRRSSRPARSVVVESAHPLAPYAGRCVAGWRGRPGGRAARRRRHPAADPARRLQLDARPRRRCAT